MAKLSTSVTSQTINWLKSLPRSQRLLMLNQARLEDNKRTFLATKPKTIPWIPFPNSPQTIAIDHPADELFFGGSAGGGKTDLLVGTALVRHQKSIIFRRRFKDLQGLRERSTEVYSGLGTFNGQKEIWRLNYQKPRVVEFGAVQLERDWAKYQGRPHDFVAFDEVGHFTRGQYRNLIGWNRSNDPNQRVRVIAAGNPPTDATGDWVIDYWGPWLDKTHPNPAKPGELRWFATVEGKDIEVKDGRTFVLVHERPCYEYDPNEFLPTDIIQPRSRSFIRARIQDNPVYMASGYMSVLQGLPEPMRSQMLLGDFEAGQEDDSSQVIPTAWILAAQARWTPRPPGWLDVLGVDVARGGDDKTVLSPRSANWMGHQIVSPGESTPNGAKVAELIIAAIPAGQAPMIHIDVIGVGSSPYDHCLQLGLDALAMNSSNASTAREKMGKFGFVNKRAEWWWRLREALDPASGEEIALPPDRELRADLTAPRWEVALRGIKIESKDDVKERIGRSTDKGDSCVYCFGTPASRPKLRIL